MSSHQIRLTQHSTSMRPRTAPSAHWHKDSPLWLPPTDICASQAWFITLWTYWEEPEIATAMAHQLLPLKSILHMQNSTFDLDECLTDAAHDQLGCNLSGSPYPSPGATPLARGRQGWSEPRCLSVRHRTCSGRYLCYMVPQDPNRNNLIRQ